MASTPRGAGRSRARGRPTAARPGARLVRGKPAAVRQPAHPRGPHRAAEHVSRKRVIRLMQEDGLQARARKRYKGTTMSDHDQPVAANLSIGGSRHRRRISAGSAIPPSSSSGERQALSGRRAGSVLPVRRRLGGQRRQRSPPHAQGARDGPEAPVSRRSGSCIIRIKDRRTRVKTTRPPSRRTASSAA